MTRTTKTACVINASVSHKNSSVYQEHSSSDQETKMQILEQQPSTKPSTICAPHVYAIHSRPKDGLDSQ